MRKVFLALTIVILLSSLASAEIIINSQPKETYNLGETIKIPITVKSLNNIYDNIILDLICGGQELNFYKNGIGLSAGEEKRIEASLILTKNMLGTMKGKCIIKTSIGEEYVNTNDFQITQSIDLTTKIDKTELNPKESLFIEGTANKKSGAPLDGFVEIKIYKKGTEKNSTQTISLKETINNGFYSANTTLPKKIPAGEYKIEIFAYEKDLTGQLTNQGTQTQDFTVKQIPTNIEIIPNDVNIDPADSMTAKAILHDQTGVNIPSEIEIKIFDPKEKLVEKLTTQTDTEFEFATKYNTNPGSYKIVAKTKDLETKKEFIIKEKMDVKLEIINNTLFVTNIGNIKYCNKTILVKIGSQALNLAPCIDLDEQEKYKLSAPNGQYEVEILSDEKEIKQNVALTGKTIEINKASEGVISLTRHPLSWFFIIAIMGFVSFTIFKKGFKKTFVGRVIKRKKTKKKDSIKKGKTETLQINKIFNTNKAELCLSIKGEKQSSVILGLNIKNIKELKKNVEGIRDTITKISSLIRTNKAHIYENEENIFIIFAPILTRTFKNEKPALLLAEEIKNIMVRHNRLFKQKIDFGLSINTGQLIVKMAGEKLQFMSLGGLMTNAKKISNHSKETILLGEKIREKLGNEIKVEKFTKNGLTFYAVKEMKEKNPDSEKFIKDFVSKFEKK